MLTFLNRPGPLARDQLLECLGDSRITGPSDALTLVDAMIAKGLITTAPDGGLAITAAGLEVFLPLRTAIERITEGLVEDIPKGDLEATRRTLDVVTRRDAEILSTAAS